jgi:glycerate 2-kinase
MSIFQNLRELMDIDDESAERSHVLEILEAGVKSVLPENTIKDLFLKRANVFPPVVKVCGWGKASIEMFNAFKSNYHGDISCGHIITLPHKDKTSGDSKIDISFGAHPLPDKASIRSGKILLAIAKELDESDTLVCLISGGGSSMFEVPKDGIDPESLRATYKLLLESGADIHEVNSVRRALSINKGGGLAKAAYPAKVINIVISDVLGNNLEDITSGPTVGDPFKIKPLQVIKRYKLEQNLDGRILETIRRYKPINKKYFQNVETYIIADNNRAVEAMLKKARSFGYNVTRFRGYLHGEARTAVNAFMETKGELIIGGGETTVTVKGSGRGGRNQEFVLAGLTKLRRGILASIGTDGIDGTTEAAGAIGDKKVLETSRAKRYDMDSFLKNNDSYGFFRDCGGLIITGPTGTNVADISVFLKRAASI